MRARNLTSALIAASALCTAAALMVVSSATPAAAAERRAPPKTKKTEVVSKKVFKQLGPAHEAISEERYADALEHLERIRAMSKLSAYEQAQMWQTFGYVYAAQEKLTRALDAFEKCMATGGLGEEQAQRLRFNLGQLYIADGQYRKGIDTIVPWFDAIESPGPGPYFLVANAYAQLEDYANALVFAERGLPLMESPRENWLQLVLALYFEGEKYPRCRDTLETLVKHFPKKQYWTQLAAVYGQLGDERKQLAAYELVHRQGMLKKNSELVRLARLYQYHAVPYKAGVLLEEGFAAGRVEDSAENWELLANSWVSAREYERAIPALGKAAGLSDDGDLYVRLGQVHMERTQWKEAASALASALAKGGLEDTGQAHLLLGIARYNLEQFDASRRAFATAARYGDTRDSARQWLRLIDSEAAAREG